MDIVKQETKTFKQLDEAYVLTRTLLRYVPKLLDRLEYDASSVEIEDQLSYHIKIQLYLYSSPHKGKWN